MDHSFCATLWAVIFYLGGMAAVGNWDMRRLDRLAWPPLALFLVLCAAVVLFEIEDRRFLHMMSPVLLWPAASLLVGTIAGKWLAFLARYSFFTFLIHAPILAVLWLAYQQLDGPVPYWAFWVSAPVMTSIVGAVAYDVSCRWLPKTMNVLTGGRADRKWQRPTDPDADLAWPRRA
jgi:succinoglycan biosynthesis protein ExoH